MIDWIVSIFNDPVLRGPLMTCIFVGGLGGIIGIWLFFQQHSLIGEVLSHATFPGMIGGAIFAAISCSIIFSYDIPFLDASSYEMVCILAGGFFSSYISVLIMHSLIKRKVAYEDSALSFILSSTFGIGLLLISLVQKEYPSLWRKLMAFLMGQAATIPNQYVSLSFYFFISIAIGFYVFRKSILSFLFDRQFTSLYMLMPRLVERAILVAIVATSMLGIRLMGVVLISAILIFPPVIARLLSDTFSTVTILSACIGSLACGLGVIISHSVAGFLQDESGKSLWLPTGPLIVLVMLGLFLAAILFSPRQGLIIRSIRRALFHWRCVRENVLKFFWKACVHSGTERISWKQLYSESPVPFRTLFGKITIYILERGRYIIRNDQGFDVTPKGLAEGRRLVRLHRLWELYLVEYCGMGKDVVHPSAEEMEHIITPDMERELSTLLHDPSFDPHRQPIPSQLEKVLLQEK